MAEAFVYDHIRTPRGRGKAVGSVQSAYAIGYARPPGPEWKAHVVRMVGIFLDGMKTR